MGFQIHSAVAVKINAVCDATPCDLNEDPVGEVQNIVATVAQFGHSYNYI